MQYPNIYSLFIDRVKMYRAAPEPRDVFYFRDDEGWQGISWERFDEEAHDFASALLSLDLKKGGAVAILMGNVPEWPIADIGVIAAGGVGVGLYPSSSAEQCQYIINNSDAEFVLVDSATQLQKVLSVRPQLPRVKTIIALDEADACNAENVLNYRELIDRGRSYRNADSALLRERAKGATGEDIAIMVYTSGTTGPPKGALLSHRYIINSVESLRQTIPIFDTDVAFSYLPYCHVAERISGLYNRLYAGASAYFVDDLAKLGTYMLEVKPTVFASLPRFFEKIHARIVSDIEASPKEERESFYRALDVGREVSRLRQERKEVPAELRQRYDTEAAPILARAKDYFGGRIRLATSGGAPLPLEVAEFFDAAGLPILQAYGLTENICVAFNRPDNHKFGTVGPPMPGCKVKIAPDGEILVSSEMMFSGYYKAPDETDAMFSDKWLLTGDIGEIDADGFLRITGRKKEIIVTSTGKKVAPALIENLLKENHLISHALVYGEGKSYLVALITINALEAAAFLRANGVDSPMTPSQSDLIRSAVQKTVDEVNARVSSTESIKKFAILDRDFEIEKDEVTPTGKLKREVVTAGYRNDIDALYK